MAQKTEQSLAERLIAGDKRALARAITLIENDDPAGLGAGPRGLPAHRSGPDRRSDRATPGVGKSTLIGALTAEMRKADRQVAVLSIDPSSPFTRGALLGDRIRLSDHFLDSGVFIRSMASRGALGGLSEATLQAALLMDASGKDDVFIETVGVGQAEIDIVDHGDTIVLVLMPGSGDSIQALKAGVMEIPDIIVVNKADHPMTDTMIREIRGVLSLGPSTSWRVPIVKTEAAKGEGVRSWPRRSPSTASTSRPRDARRTKGQESAQRGARAGGVPDAAAPGGGRRGRRLDPRAARPRRQARPRSRERGQGATRARGWRPTTLGATDKHHFRARDGRWDGKPMGGEQDWAASHPRRRGRRAAWLASIVAGTASLRAVAEGPAASGRPRARSDPRGPLADEPDRYGQDALGLASGGGDEAREDAERSPRRRAGRLATVAADGR